MKAIETKFLPCTNSRGSRITAFDLDNNRITLSYDHSLNSEENHRAAAIALCNKMQWNDGNDTLHGGTTKTGMCFVFVPHDNTCAVCGIAGPMHGHYDVTDARTHKFVSR